MDIKAIFDTAAQDYDRTRQQLIPCFDDFYGTALDLIPHYKHASIKMLDLGAGTGLLSGLVVAAFPHAAITLADISPAMLSKARERFGLNPNIAYLSLDFVTTLIPGKFDVVISALALHHTPQPELKGVFQKVFDIQSTPMANRSRFRARGLLVQKLLLCRLLWPKIMLLIASNQAFTRCLLRDTIRRCTR